MGQKHEVKKHGHNAPGGWYVVSVRYWAIHLFPGGGVLASQLGTDASTKKNDGKELGSAQCCHRLGSEKWHFSGKRVGFLKSDGFAVKLAPEYK